MKSIIHHAKRIGLPVYSGRTMYKFSIFNYR